MQEDKKEVLSMNLGITLILVISAMVQAFLPWWSIAVVGLGIGFVAKNTALQSFLMGFLAQFAIWFGYALWIHISEEGRMATVMADVLGGKLPPFALVVVTGLIGGLVCGLSSLTGGLLRKTR